MTPNPMAARQSRQRWLDLLTVLALALPFAVYAGVLWRYAVNIPFYDDITQIVWISNTLVHPAFESPWVLPHDKPDTLHALFYPNAGHIPLFTRLFTLLQYALGGANFRHSIFVANAGWLLTCLLLLWYGRRQLQLPLHYLLPLPYLLLAITHWEAMDFALPAWQMYWGAAFFPAAMLLALERQRILMACACFFGALFLSGGSLALFPLAVAYLGWRRRWLPLAVFAVAGGLMLWLFLHFNPPGYHLRNGLPDIGGMLLYTLRFMGNLLSTGGWDLSPHATVHTVTGAVVLLAAAAYGFTTREQDFPRLLLLYLVLLGGMAAFKRIDAHAYVVSRYAMFALMGVVAVYGLFIARHRLARPRFAAASLTVLVLASVAFWAHSLVVNQAPLLQNHDDRIAALQHFIDTGDASKLMWHAEWGAEILQEAQRTGVYDYSAALQDLRR